jgi:Fe-S-cluster containining protein
MIRKIISAIADSNIYFHLFKRRRSPVKIQGACKMTGRCCQALMLGYGLRPIRTVREFEKMKKKREHYKMFQPVPKEYSDGYLRFSCANLTEDHLCGIHDTRPEMCRRYPDPLMFRFGGELLPGCGYELVPAVSFEEELVAITKKK